MPKVNPDCLLLLNEAIMTSVPGKGKGGIDHSANPHDEDGASSLCQAAAKSHFKVAELLLGAEADVNQKCGNSTTPSGSFTGGIAVYRTPLHAAVDRGDTAMAAFLLDNNAETDVPDSAGVTALATAARYAQPEMVALLLARGAAISCNLQEGVSAIEWALFPDRTTETAHRLSVHDITVEQETDILELLLHEFKSGADKLPADTFMHAALLQPAARADKLTLLLLDNYAQTGDQDFTFLAEDAVRGGWSGCISRMLQLQPSIVDAEFETPLLVIAVLTNHTDVGRQLLEAGADANVGGEKNPLVYACSKGNYAFAKALVEAGADVNFAGHMTPLMYALAGESEDIARMLLEHKADPDAQSSAGFSAVDLANSGKSNLAAAMLSDRIAEHGAEAKAASETAHSADVAGVADVAGKARASTADADLIRTVGFGLGPPVLIFLLWSMHRSQTRSRYKKMLTEVYSKHAPEKMNNIDAVLDAYAGREAALEQALKAAYGGDAKKGKAKSQ
jgi:ankyrin repeat protein